MKLSALATIVMAGALAACGKAPEATTQAVEGNKVDAVQKIGPYNNAVEFTPKTDTNKQCIAIIASTNSEKAGGVTCWDKKPSP